MNDDLPTIAMDFCRTVLGWGWHGEIRHNEQLETLRRAGDTAPYAFRYTDLERVFDEVDGFACRQHAEACLRFGAGEGYVASIDWRPKDGDGFPAANPVPAVGHHRTPHGALMLAAIEAAKREG